jgi:DNA-binding NarL/FixJ family response regulator
LKETLRLAAGLQLVGEADRIEDGLAVLQRSEIDVVILDLNLARISGLDVIPLILEQAPTARVILLLDQNDHRYHKAAAKKGASACVVKQSIATELVPTVQRVVTGSD